MSFAFGNTQTQQPTLGFGSTPAKVAFGTNFSFGSTPGTTTASSTGFGGFGTTFGTPATTATGFGTTFGTPATSAPAFGTPAFGTTSSAAPAFGTTFGSTAASAFGNTSTFGTPASTGFGTFGQTAPATTTQPGLFCGFGSTATTTTASGFTGFSGFGAPTATTGSLSFGGFGGAFGQKPATTTTTFGGFGTSFATPLGQQQQQQQQTFQQPQQLQQQQQPLDPNQAVLNSVFNCTVFGDERDAVLAKWNLLQASWGTGKGFYSQAHSPVDYTVQNPLCRFKAIGYSVIPGHDNKEGLVAVIFNKKETDVKAQKDQLFTNLNSILGSKPNLTLTIHSIRAITETKSQVLIFVEEKCMSGTIRKIPASDLSNYLLQPMPKQQLQSLGVENVFAHLKPDADQLNEYLCKAPAGVDIRIWKQAQLDNPDPQKYIPIPIIGFEQLKWRGKCQEKETALHCGFMEQVSKDISSLKQRHSASVAQIIQQKRRLFYLQHDVLGILVNQEVTRKVGTALVPEEEVLKGQLENMHNQICVSTQFKGRIREMLAQIRMFDQDGQTCLPSERYKMDSGVQNEIKQFLSMEQGGIKHLVDIVNTDLANLKIIKDGMQELVQQRK